MVKIFFSAHFNKHVAVEQMEVSASTVGDALAQAFIKYPTLRGYVLDDHGVVRKHVMIFVGDEFLVDRKLLSDPVDEKGEIHVMQALSGG